MSFKSPFIKTVSSLAHKRFTGILTVISQSNQQWNIYFYLGMLLWVEGGVHTYRFWKRHLSSLAPHIDLNKLNSSDYSNSCSSDYYLVDTLLKKQLASRNVVIYIINQRIKDIFFDVLQEESHGSLEIIPKSESTYYLLKKGFNISLFMFDPIDLGVKASQGWLCWTAKGLTSCSPNRSPVLKTDRELSKNISQIVLFNMKRLLNGDYTLRDLSIKMDKNVFDITCNLVPYFFKGYIRLINVPDLPGLTINN